MGLKHTEVCSEKDCYNPYYAKHLCKRHYKMMLGRAGGYRKDYERIKKKSSYKQMKRESDLRYRRKLERLGVLAERRRKYYRTWITKRENLHKKRLNSFIGHNKYYFGGVRDQVLERDGSQCVKCGMSRSDHYLKYSCDLNVHHIDGKGWGVKKEERNNQLDNLITLCHSCHRKERPLA